MPMRVILPVLVLSVLAGLSPARADQINSDAAENRVAQDFRLNHSAPGYAERSFLSSDRYVPADSERRDTGPTDLRGVYADPDD